MKTPHFTLCLVIGAFSLALGGCGGSTGSSQASNSSPFNGIYRTTLNRGNSAVTVYLNYPEVEVVVTDEGAALPSYVGTSTSLATNTSGSITFTSLPLIGSDGESAQASGTFGVDSLAGIGNAVSLSLTGGVGYSGQVPLTSSSTNSLYVGTYSGTYASSYLLETTTVKPAAGAVSNLTLAADLTTGGYDMTAAGTTTDPTGNPVNFTITKAQVDPCGIVSNLSVVYSYANGTTPSVTNTFPTAFLNLGVVASTTLVGYQQASISTWPDAAIETDTMVLTQTGNTALKSKAKVK